jgi:hypothetical protein
LRGRLDCLVAGAPRNDEIVSRHPTETRQEMP